MPITGGVLIAVLAVAGAYYGGKTIVKGAKKLEHGAAKVVHCVFHKGKK